MNHAPFVWGAYAIAVLGFGAPMPLSATAFTVCALILYVCIKLVMATRYSMFSLFVLLPRPLIDAIIDAVRPQPGETIQDPAAGTGGFLIAADRAIRRRTDDLYDLTEAQRAFQRHRAFIGMELVTGTRRLALMNGLLHGIEGGDDGMVRLGNTLGSAGSGLPKSDLILSNPPFVTAKGGGGPTRDDLTYATHNKQLAFLQHIVRHLKDGGQIGRAHV